VPSVYLICGTLVSVYEATGLAHPDVGCDGGSADWTVQPNGAEVAVTLNGRLGVSAADGVRAAVLANAGLAIASEWMFAPEIADGTVEVVLQDWELPTIDLWAVFPAGRTATTKARTFTQFVQEVIRLPSDVKTLTF
jgi:DNA-binding transcriptional LysR family regulator